VTNDELNTWWQDFTDRWPDMGTWFSEGRSEQQQIAILRNWAQALADVNLHEALAVNRGMYAGDLAGFTGRWDRDRIPAIVRQHAIAARPAAITWTGPNDPDPHLQPRSELPVRLNGTLHQLIAMKGRGASQAECEQFLRKAFPAEPLARQRRYSCSTCCDSGHVEVWHPERVFVAERDGIEAALRCHYATSTAACPCKAGDLLANRSRPLARFDSHHHCLAAGGDVTSHKAVAMFQEWLHTRRAVERRENYEPAFAAYKD
jgi:hypothetical protein